MRSVHDLLFWVNSDWHCRWHDWLVACSAEDSWRIADEKHSDRQPDDRPGIDWVLTEACVDPVVWSVDCHNPRIDYAREDPWSDHLADDWSSWRISVFDLLHRWSKPRKRDWFERIPIRRSIDFAALSIAYLNRRRRRYSISDCNYIFSRRMFQPFNDPSLASFIVFNVFIACSWEGVSSTRRREQTENHIKLNMFTFVGWSILTEQILLDHDAW